MIEAGSGKIKKHIKPIKSLFPREDYSKLFTRYVKKDEDWRGLINPYYNKKKLENYEAQVFINYKILKKEIRHDPFFRIPARHGAVQTKEVVENLFRGCKYLCYEDEGDITRHLFMDIPAFDNIEIAILSTPKRKHYRVEYTSHSVASYYAHTFNSGELTLDILLKEKRLKLRRSIIVPLDKKEDPRKHKLIEILPERVIPKYNQSYATILVVKHIRHLPIHAQNFNYFFNAYFSPKSLEQGLRKAIKKNGGRMKNPEGFYGLDASERAAGRMIDRAGEYSDINANDNK